MKKLLLISILMGALPFTMVAQDDDLYFVSKKKVAEKQVTYNDGLRSTVYHSGSNRSVDEYNRMESKYVVIGNDSVNDIIEFSGVKGVYPDSLSMASDSLAVEDYALTKKMVRFDDYDLTENAAFWAGYHLGRDTWSWHSPWYYRSYGWYGGWYDPWYYSIYDPWYYRYGGFYDPWYYSYYDPWYFGWHDPWRYGWGYYPYGYYYDYYPYYVSYGGGGRYHSNGNTGTINMRGGSRVVRNDAIGGGRNNSGRIISSRGSERTSSLRDRTVGTARTVNNNNTTTRNNTTFNGGSRINSGTYSNSSTYSSSRGGGGGFSSGGGGVSRSSGGGGVGGGSRGGRR